MRIIKTKGILSTLFFVAVLLFISFTVGSKASEIVQGSSQKEISTKNVVGTWVNHHDKNLHQKITFTKNHKWHENQHDIKNIYSGHWKIIGKRTIKLTPYNEKIVFDKNNFHQIKVVNYHHILNKKK
ncbi:hypothetical protein [Companilactobacillus halodurans]|uniref:DUF5640 domain-containing protein n=1 Tax=Companilactobacillus halodurans TaxID=2584183 RepID=A0A5P0ZMS0_9LACO|nr:hypothetical protein [Companilactobacillus halodurans]MQS75515.1 hypothetical protein [Companilactobacillus halodurans]MQS97759.1 hypothetical protein [Companilactobacillus halodurans]